MHAPFNSFWDKVLRGDFPEHNPLDLLPFIPTPISPKIPQILTLIVSIGYNRLHMSHHADTRSDMSMKEGYLF